MVMLKLTDYDIQGSSIEDTEICSIKINESLNLLGLKTTKLYRNQLITVNNSTEEVLSIVQGRGNVIISTNESFLLVQTIPFLMMVK
jgi:hypothetical protein